ncbi:hypothetical protein IWQ57_001718, partial [Coemansia nantahalensis]
MMAQMAMMPPKSPYLTNVGLAGAPPLPPVAKQQSALSLRTQRSREGAEMKQGAQPPQLSRSNSAAAKTAEAVIRLQAIPVSPPMAQAAQQLATPPVSANVPMAAADKTPLTSPQRQTAARFTPVPTLRDMLLNHHSPPKPAAPALPKAAAGKAPPAFRTQPSSQSSRQSSPEPVRTKPARSMSTTSSEGEQELSKSEEDVRERLQRVWIALGRPMGSITEQPEDTPASPTAADVVDLRREIDAVADMLLPSSDESHDDDGVEGLLSGVEIDQQPIDVQLDRIGIDSRPASAETSSDQDGPEPERKLSDERTAGDPSRRPAAAPSRLLAPTASSLAKSHRPPVPRAPTPSGIPRKPTLRTQASNSSISSAGSQTSTKIGGPPAHAANGRRVAEARRKFEAARPKTPSGAASVVAGSGGLAQYATPVAAMRPGYSSIVQTPAAAAAQQRRAAAPPRQGPRTTQKSSTAAMREAARRAEAAARAHHPPRPRPAANEPLFKSVAAKPGRPVVAKQPSREQLRPRQQAGGASAIPVPVSSKGKEPAHAEPSGSAEAGGWGVGSMLSPSSWNSRDSPPGAGPASALAETPTGPAARLQVASPYDVHSPQAPYQPRPEHGGGRADQLVMPSYQDVAVPLRR